MCVVKTIGQHVMRSQGLEYIQLRPAKGVSNARQNELSKVSVQVCVCVGWGGVRMVVDKTPAERVQLETRCVYISVCVGVGGGMSSEGETETERPSDRGPEAGARIM